MTAWDLTVTTAVGDVYPYQVDAADSDAARWAASSRFVTEHRFETSGAVLSPAMPAAAEHAPVSVLNRTGAGIRTVVHCSCGWVPRTAPDRGSTMNTKHARHRRTLGLDRADYAATVMGEGPWQGMTWDAWYAKHGGQGTDPYTGDAR
jgi:hypothetical protein